MRPGRMRGALIAVAGMMIASGAAAAPIETYGRLPSVDDVRISPDGTEFAAITHNAAGGRIQVNKTDDLSLVVGAPIGNAKLIGLDWADATNLLMVTARATEVIGLDGPRREWWQAGDIDLQTKKLNALMNSSDTEMNVISSWPQARTINGKTMLFLVGLSFPENQGVLTLYRQQPNDSMIIKLVTGNDDTSDMILDSKGNLVARVDYNERSGLWSLFARSPGGSLHEVHRETDPIEQPSVEGFGRTQDTLIIGQEENDTIRYREIPLAGGAWSPPIAALDGASLIKDPSTRTVIGGVVTEGMGLRYTFLDPKDQALWDQIARAFPSDTVRLASWNNDRSKIVLQVEGAKSGAAYYLLDVKTHHADWLTNEYDGISADDLGEVRTISYAAQDGRQIPAYLTLPHGVPAKGLPLVLLVHGGPAARDDPGFDWWAQAIASLGYVVLQPQYRGSDGFGDDLLRAGYGEWGRKMQTDLSDGVHYLAQQGIVDPDRVCITGGSYGGYAAMAGVTLQSGIYKCAVSVAGVSDLRRMLSSEIDNTGGTTNSTLRFWKRFMGAKTSSDPTLDAISPLRQIDKLTVPLLLIHGTIDTVVPFDQSKIMFDAARKAGKPVQLVTLAGEDHNLSRSPTRLQMLQAMADFLRKNLPPALPAATATAASAKP